MSLCTCSRLPVEGALSIDQSSYIMTYLGLGAETKAYKDIWERSLVWTKLSLAALTRLWLRTVCRVRIGMNKNRRYGTFTLSCLSPTHPIGKSSHQA